MRKRRKLEHLHLALNIPDGPISTGLEDVFLVHNSIPEINLEEVDLKTTFFGKELRFPLIINAMTGGIDEAEEINRTLSLLAAKNGIAIAVGSQMVSKEKGASLESFRVVRRVNRDGVILANVSAFTDFSLAMRAIEMIEADGVQVHLNIPQELAMPEGDRCFKGMLDNIAQLVAQSPVPVIAKEVGFGLSREAATYLLDTGVEYLDIGGLGGTNFITIENRRGGLFDSELAGWGIPTAVSLMEVLSLRARIGIIASGGIRNALQAAKALALGADLVGIAGPLLKMYFAGGDDALQAQVDTLFYQLKAITLMTGARTVRELSSKPVLVTGKTAEWIQARGIDTGYWARR